MKSYNYNDIKEWGIGQKAYQSSYLGNIKFIVTEKPIETYSEELKKNQISFKAKNTEDNEVIRFLITEGLEHYGPSLYSYPAYSMPPFNK